MSEAANRVSIAALIERNNEALARVQTVVDRIDKEWKQTVDDVWALYREKCVEAERWRGRCVHLQQVNGALKGEILELQQQKSAHSERLLEVIKNAVEGEK